MLDTLWGKLDNIGLVALALAIVGVWGAWIFHASVALTLNAFYLAEWSTYLLDVRYDGLRAAPEILRAGLALAAMAGAVALAIIPNFWLRWLARLALIPIGLNLLPPYPDIFSLWWSPSYGGRFMAASIFWLGLAACLWLDRRNIRLRRWLVIGCGLGAMVSAVWAYGQLIQPFQAHYAMTLRPGWGLVVFVAGLLIAAGAALRLQLSGPANPQNQKGPVA
jgi:hypothetical protein